MLKRQSDEEKEAKRLEKELQKQASAERKSAEAQAKAERQEQEGIERERQAFLASPAGLARTAFERGDQLFQFEIDVKNTKAAVIPMVTATTNTSSTDPVEILNSVCHEGWDLVNGSFVFHELGSESRDKFMASGQNIAVKGTVIGYYVFRRCEENRKQPRELLDSATV
jgi:hypothetical protein